MTQRDWIYIYDLLKSAGNEDKETCVENVNDQNGKEAVIRR